MGELNNAERIIKIITILSLILFFVSTIFLLRNGDNNYVHTFLPLFLALFLFIVFFLRVISLPSGNKRVFSKYIFVASIFLLIAEIINTVVSFKQGRVFVFNTPADIFYFISYVFFFMVINLLLEEYFKHNKIVFFVCVSVLTVFGYYLLSPILTSPLFKFKEKIFNLFYLVASLIVMLLSLLILVNKRNFLSFSEKIFFVLAIFNNSLYNFYSLVINYKGFYKTPPIITSFFSLTYLFLIIASSLIKTTSS